jgi:hypothetical protein
MKNFRKYINLVAVGLFLLTGCNDDFLNTTPTDQLSPDTFFENEEQVKQGVMGIYNAMSQSEFQGVLEMHHDFASDNNYNFHAWQGNQALGNWTLNSTNAIAARKWRRNYRSISRANNFLEIVTEAPIDENAKNIYKAEARFLRAIAYADLIQYFGDVPLITERLSLEEAEVPRTPKEEVLQVITDDFDYAIQNLPEVNDTETGRATKGAAYALKARYMLYNEEYQKAADAAKNVIDLENYSLFPDYEGIHKVENENNEEIIFAWQYMHDQQPQPWPSTCLQYSVWWTQGVTLDITNSYYMDNGMPIEKSGSGYNPQDPAQDRDPRLNQTFVLPGDQIGDKTLIPDEDVFIGGIRIKKYNGIPLPDMQNCHLDWVLMRYADVLLIRAESLIEMGNTSQEVYNLINQVRQRPTVDMPRIQDSEGTGLSQGELRDILRHERRVEFAMEGTRFEDMQRWECEECVHDVYGYNKEKLSDPNDAPDNWYFEKELYEQREFDQSKGWRWPIPQEELQNNPELEQNPGY